MAKRLRSYLCFLEQTLARPLTEKEASLLLSELLTQLSFFQHERLLHLIVTATVAILTISIFITCLFYQSVSLFLLLLLLVCLLVPYLLHYYRLENGVQQLYVYYDKLLAHSRAAARKPQS